MTQSLRFEQPGQPADPAAVAGLERELGRALPADYRRFLLEVGGGKPEANVLEGDPRVGVQRFLDLGGTLDLRRHQYSDRVPAEHLPIADAEGGNLLLLDLAAGAVWFWDHEREAEEGAPPDPGAVSKVADSFADLLARLRPPPASDAVVASAWVNPALLRRVKPDEGGITPVLMLFVVITVGLGMAFLQVGRATVTQTTTQSGADAAALAAARELRDQMIAILQTTGFNEAAALNYALATAAAADYAQRNGTRLDGPPQFLGLRVRVAVETARPLGDTTPLDRAEGARGHADATAQVDIFYAFAAVQAGVGGSVGGGGSCPIPGEDIRLAAEEAGVDPGRAAQSSVLARYAGCGNAPGVSVSGLQFEMRVALLQVEEALGGPLVLASGFRTPAYQAQLCQVVERPVRAARAVDAQHRPRGRRGELPGGRGGAGVAPGDPALPAPAVERRRALLALHRQRVRRQPGDPEPWPDLRRQHRELRALRREAGRVRRLALVVLALAAAACGGRRSRMSRTSRPAAAGSGLRASSPRTPCSSRSRSRSRGREPAWSCARRPRAARSRSAGPRRTTRWTRRTRTRSSRTRSSVGGSARWSARSADTTVDGAPAITFAQTDATDGEQRIGTVVVDHAGTRFVIALATQADAYDPVAARDAARELALVRRSGCPERRPQIEGSRDRAGGRSAVPRPPCCSCCWALWPPARRRRHRRSSRRGRRRSC